MEVTEAIVALVRMPSAERRGYLADLHTRAVQAARRDVAEFVVDMLERLGAEPATPDGRIRSRCVDKACGQAWVADKDSPLPTGWGSPLPDCYRYAGAVGTRSSNRWLAFPAVRLVEPEPNEVAMMEFGRVTPVRTCRPAAYGAVEYHDPHLIQDLDGEFVLVVDDAVSGARVAVPRARHVQFDPLTPRGDCTRIRADLVLYPTAAGERFRGWVDPALITSWEKADTLGPSDG